MAVRRILIVRLLPLRGLTMALRVCFPGFIQAFRMIRVRGVLRGALTRLPFHLKATERIVPRLARRVARRLRELTLSVTLAVARRTLRGLTAPSLGAPRQSAGPVVALGGTGVVV